MLIETIETGLLKDPVSGACIYTPETIELHKQHPPNKIDILEQKIQMLEIKLKTITQLLYEIKTQKY